MWPKLKGRSNAIRSESDGYSFQSGLERAVYEVLKLRVLANEIEIVQVQAQVDFAPEGSGVKIVYKPDFKLKDLKSGEIFYAEAKGHVTDAWSLKKRLWKIAGPGRLEIWMGTKHRPFLFETLPAGEFIWSRRLGTIDKSFSGDL